jgi:putative ABC transport system permease protein
MVRLSVRMWSRSLLLTAQFSATIAIGMGAATALVSLLLALGYQPLPYRDPGRLVAVWELPESGGQLIGISGPDLADFRDATHSIFATFGGFTSAPLWVLDDRGAAKIRTCYIHGSVFSDLGIRPVLGREVRPDDEPVAPAPRARAAVPPAWIGYEFWQSRYGGSSSVIGATIGLGSSATEEHATLVQIVGVLPRRVSVPLPFTNDAIDVWYLMEPDSAARPRQNASFLGLGRLRPGISVAQAEAALGVVLEGLGQRYTFERRKRPVVQSLEAIAQGAARQTMGLLVLGVGLVFLVGCVNLAILMGVEGRRRQREIAIRAALGAGRWRLWREVAAEKCLLALLSVGLGVAFAPALLRVLAWLVPAAGLGPPLPDPPPLNLAVLFGFGAFALAAALVWSALLVAAATTDGPEASRALSTSGGPGFTGLSDRSRGAGRWRLILAAVQAGTAICLLAAAATTVGAYATRSVANLGPAPRRTVLLSVSTRDNVFLNDPQTLDFDRQVLSQLGRLPGTEAIALVDVFPPPGSPVPFLKQGDAADVQRTATYAISVSPSYFRTLGIPILFGRGFDDTDNMHGEKVAIISLDMAEKNWTSPKDAVGSQINYGSKFQNRYKILGVAANFTGYWSQKPFPMVYLPEAQSANGCGEVILRTTASADSVAALARQLLNGITIPAVITDVSTMQARWQSTVTRPLARMAGMLLIGLLGLALCVQGVYAVAAGTVAARGHELAVRSALGGQPSQLAWNVTRELVLAVMVGAGFGVAAALEFRPLLEQWLGPTAVWQVEPIAAAVVLLGLAAAAGCYVPARAALRAYPAALLRQG